MRYLLDMPTNQLNELDQLNQLKQLLYVRLIKFSLAQPEIRVVQWQKAYRLLKFSLGVKHCRNTR